TYASVLPGGTFTSPTVPTPGTKPTSRGLPGWIVVVVLVLVVVVVVGHAGVFVSTVTIVDVPAEFHAVTPYVYAVGPLAVVSATGKTGVGPSCRINVNAVS